MLYTAVLKVTAFWCCCMRPPRLAESASVCTDTGGIAWGILLWPLAAGMYTKCDRDAEDEDFSLGLLQVSTDQWPGCNVHVTSSRALMRYPCRVRKVKYGHSVKRAYYGIVFLSDCLLTSVLVAVQETS